jgi:predicted permease
MILDSVVRDVRYAMRGLRRSPGFLATAVLTLGLGIGATATMYSVVHDVLLAPLAYPESDRLVGIGFRFPTEKPAAEQTGGTADFIREHGKSFDSVGIADDSSYGMNLSAPGGARPMRLESAKVTAGFFPTLGVKPVLGRMFTSEDDLPGGPKVAMLSFWVWQRTFGGDLGVLGKPIRLNEEPYTVIGVLPEAASNTGEASDVLTMNAGIWLPAQMSKKDPGYDGDNYVMIGRLREGVSLKQAQQELDSLTGPMYEANPIYKDWMTNDANGGKIRHEYRAWPLKTVIVTDVKQSLLALLAAVVAVLLVACLNLAGLMTARASTRTRELALRTALGATRGGLLRLLVCESLILAVAGGVLGLGIAQVAKPALVASAPMVIPVVHGAGGWWSVVGVVAVVAFLTTLVCGLLPGWTVFRQDAQAALKGGQGAGANVAQMRVGKGLMVGQVAVAMVLLSAASLLLGSFLKLQAVPSGVETKRLDVAQVLLKGDAYATNLHTTQFVEKVVGTLGQYPGVTRVAAVNGLPLDRGLNMGGHPADQPNLKGVIEFRAVTPGYFRAMGVPVMEGREIGAEDRATSAHVAVVSATAAKKWWPGRSAIGQIVVFGRETTYTVVGVAADVHSHSLAERLGVVTYVPFEQMSDEMTKIVNGWFPTTFVMRTAADIDVAAAVAKAVGDADPEMPVAKLSTMQSVVDKTVSGPRFFSWMSGGFAAFALLLTVIGLFGLLSYQVTQRTREIGVRMAIGAGRGEILRLILGRGLTLTVAGLVAGGLMSLAVPKLVASVLVDVVNTGGAGIGTMLSNSSMALIVAAFAMLMAAGLASWLPARRAAAVEPIEALRAE